MQQKKTIFIFVFTIFLGAFLIFQVQPLISKFILPWFGGTPSVWTVCMLFFQVSLFGGYLYAYLLATKTKPLIQFFIHGVLLLVSVILVFTRTILPESMNPDPRAEPVWQILGILAVTIGLPYFTLAATSPLVQFWFGSKHIGKEPYVLYAVSNTGSLLALISYPLVIEPLLNLRMQSIIWSGCFALFALVCGFIAWTSTRQRQTESQIPAKAVRTGLSEQILWLVLPMLAVMLLLAVTNQMGTDVSSGPFLWVLPLCIYLFTFILTFTGWRFVYNRVVFYCILVAGFIAIVFMLRYTARFSFLLQILIYSAVLYCGCTALHGELYRLRPERNQLTKFYLFTSAGGALGGIFVGLVAPLVFRNFYELHYTTVAILAAIIICAYRNKDFFSGKRTGSRKRTVTLTVSIMLSAGVACAFIYQALQKMEITREVRRNFFGVVQVREYNPEMETTKGFLMVHGITTHGVQFKGDILKEIREIPTAYYYVKSGVGIVLTEFPRTTGSLQIGAVGMGIGTIAAYAWPGDLYRFYEINPDVIALAQDGRYFHYLEDAKKRGAQIDIVQGDARLSMEKEVSSGSTKTYDIIVLDAFSSDSIPMHLLTKEAFACYFSLLKNNGVIAVHITNNHLDLSPVIAAIADHYKVSAIFWVSEANSKYAAVPAFWVLLTNNPYFVEKYYKGPMLVKRILWTDDFSNLWSILK